MINLSVLNPPRDVNASAAAHASKSKLLCSHQISASLGRAEAAVTKPASFKCVAAIARSLLIGTDYFQTMENAILDSHAVVLLKDKLC